MMEIITASMLSSLCEEKKREFEGLLPLLVKKLILHSCIDIDSIRMPHGEDIWAPGFDGFIHCTEKTTYVASGYSVWEFGTNRDSLTKIDNDYDKRTTSFHDLPKEETFFIL